ncbi:MAG: hypothetical protein IPN19_01020 [Elusimicrobia bacterium]|nr:hypothetical protein [Elusimicrobiota bacterium]
MIFISFLLGTPVFSANNYDSYNDRNNLPSHSYNSFERDQQLAAYRVASFANHSYTIPMRPPVQFPKVNLDFNFHSTFSSPKLDWGRGPISQPRFDARPVVNIDRNFLTSNDFNTTDSPQVFQKPDVAVLRKDTVKLPDSILWVNRNVNTGLDLKSKSITPPQQDLLPTNQIKGRVLDLVPPALGRFYGVTDHQTPVAPQRTDATSSLRPSTSARIFDAVASSIKTVPALFQSVGQKISELGKAVWNRVVLGHRTVQSFKLPDGSALDGKITINRKDALVSVAPGTVRTVGQIQETKTGPTFIPATTPVKINDQDYTQGKFVSNGTTYNLDGPGIRLSNEARPNIETSKPFKVYVNGDGQGGETILGLGSVSPESRFKETTSGLHFRNRGGMWGLDANQSGTLNLNGSKIPITISETGRLDKPIKSDVLGSKVSQSIGGILPHPETGGFQITGSAQIGPDEHVQLGIPGIRPSQYTADQINDWRQETSVKIKQSGFEGFPTTEATLHQEGNKYVFTQGHVTFAAVTGPADGNKGQKTLYNEAVLSDGSRLKINGPTDFPNYNISVVAGNVCVVANCAILPENKTLYKINGQPFNLTVKMNDRIVAINVKSVNLAAGTFVAELPDIPFKDGEFVQSGFREVKGTIDFENAQATLTNTSIKLPLLKPRETPGLFEAGPELTGNGYVMVEDNTISLRTDRLVNLNDYKNLEERKPIWTTTMNDRYATAMDAFINPDNTMVQRTGGLLLATSVLPAKVVEDAFAFTVDSAHNARDFAHHTFLAFKEPLPGDKLLESLKAVESVVEYAIRVEPGATAGVQTSRLAVKEGITLARQLVNTIKDVAPDVLRPAMGQAGHILVPERVGELRGLKPLELPSSPKALSTGFRSKRELSSIIKFETEADAVVGWRNYKTAFNSKEIMAIGRNTDTEIVSTLPLPGHRILNIEKGWTPEVNDAWIQGGIDRQAKFYLVSPQNSVTLRNASGESMFARELRQLRTAGYRQVGDFMLPPK